jgi:hypothetical protein
MCMFFGATSWQRGSFFRQGWKHDSNFENVFYIVINRNAASQYFFLI